jgi:death-on-curing protein
MPNWIWLDGEMLLVAHDEQLAEHGGATGIRDRGLFESASARPKNLAAHGKPDAASLAAAYCHGLAKNHAFVDGNKRISLVALEVFLVLNGYRLDADDAQCVLIILSIASGAMGEDELARWIKRHIVQV